MNDSLRFALEMIGMDWPGTDEDLVRGWADLWREYQIDGDGPSLRGAVNYLAEHNEGPGIAAFAAHINESDTVMNRYEDFAKGCVALAGGCEAIATLVLMVKLAVIAQLISLAASIISAIASAGLGSAAVFAAKKLAKELIQFAIAEAVAEILAE